MAKEALDILIIENDPDVVEAVALVLHMRWPDARIAATDSGAAGIELAGSDEVDVIILDLGLPDIDGFDVIREIRAFSATPIIVLSVRSGESDIARALDEGADDYIAKPYSPLELIARLRARVSDRDEHAAWGPLSYGQLTLDPLKRELAVGDKSVNLTVVELQIMRQLIRRAGGIVPFLALAESVWGEEHPGALDSLRVYIRRLRKKVEDDPSYPKLLLTKTGVGYYLAKPALNHVKCSADALHVVLRKSHTVTP